MRSDLSDLIHHMSCGQETCRGRLDTEGYVPQTPAGNSDENKVMLTR